jgi:hypothetical protein
MVDMQKARDRTMKMMNTIPAKKKENDEYQLSLISERIKPWSGRGAVVSCMGGGGTCLPAETEVKISADRRRPVTGRRRGDRRRRFADPTTIHGRRGRRLGSRFGLALHLVWEPANSTSLVL